VATLDGTVISLTPAGESAPRDERAEEAFRSAMRLLPTGVVLVLVDVGGRPWALTVSACCSLSVVPPRLLVSLSRHTVTAREVLRRGRLGVSILSREQYELAAFGAATGAPKFLPESAFERDVVDGHEITFVRGALATLDCRVNAAHDLGDHSIVIADVEQVVIPSDAAQRVPLVYFQGAFRTLSDDFKEDPQRRP
jgi:flavin reductase ActVB